MLVTIIYGESDLGSDDVYNELKLIQKPSNLRYHFCI
jgi:hypothetical protein